MHCLKSIKDLFTQHGGFASTSYRFINTRRHLKMRVRHYLSSLFFKVLITTSKIKHEQYPQCFWFN